MSDLGLSYNGRPASPSTSLYDYSLRKGSTAIVSSSSSEATNDDDDGTALPFPEALPRSDFLTADFSPAEYLSALRDRHQTLEDLRADLRERSTAINAELLELVNSNYTAFLSLGTDLHSGDEKVSDVQMSLLGFRRALEERKSSVHTRGFEVQTLNNELKTVREEIEIGRKMIEADDILCDLEARLSIDSLPQATVKTPTLSKAILQTPPTSATDTNWFSDLEDDDDVEETQNEGRSTLGTSIGTSPAKLAALVASLQRVERLFAKLGGLETPFVAKAEERRLRCRNTIMLDLSNATKAAKQAGPGGQGHLLSYMGLYRTLGASTEAVKILKGK
ncbi:hypothetical protein Cpir12675_004809 [Ceratocystis pirilliformis]|uniref:Conserved oligomeric Golgi complex subunit 2 n=1 Tax=Ceratocystis pirilliformis TaxID=259994 RepID=A0ABR3YTW3_9PEZI